MDSNDKGSGYRWVLWTFIWASKKICNEKNKGSPVVLSICSKIQRILVHDCFKKDNNYVVTVDNWKPLEREYYHECMIFVGSIGKI